MCSRKENSGLVWITASIAAAVARVGRDGVSGIDSEGGRQRLHLFARGDRTVCEQGTGVEKKLASMTREFSPGERTRMAEIFPTRPHPNALASWGGKTPLLGLFHMD